MVLSTRPTWRVLCLAAHSRLLLSGSFNSSREAYCTEYCMEDWFFLTCRGMLGVIAGCSIVCHGYPAVSDVRLALVGGGLSQTHLGVSILVPSQPKTTLPSNDCLWTPVRANNELFSDPGLTLGLCTLPHPLPKVTIQSPHSPYAHTMMIWVLYRGPPVALCIPSPPGQCGELWSK